MNPIEFTLVYFILLPHTILLVRCDNISFSICWLSKDRAFARENINIWLNNSALKSIRTERILTSLTVSGGVENKLTLKYGGTTQTWTFTISSRTKLAKIKGRKKPENYPTNSTQAVLQMLSPTEVFACENGTLFFHQEEDFILTLGHTVRLPVHLESWTLSTLLVSWVENQPATPRRHNVSIYRAERPSYRQLGINSTTLSQYHFTGLDSCTPYAACVAIAGTQSLTCLFTITDPDIPKDFEMTSWNSSSISLSWDPPQNQKFSLFLLTVFYLNGTNHVTKEVAFWHKMENFEFMLSDLQPCSRVQFGLQTVCQAGMESRYSEMILNHGNLDHSHIEDLRQTSHGPENYTLTWAVRDNSSISRFMVFHEELLQGTTLTNNYTVVGLDPCHRYQARVEAVCGDSVLMGATSVTVHTGPRGVSDLWYRSSDSTALWNSGTSNQKAVAYLYELSLENGTTLQISNMTKTELHLPGLEEGKTYILDVREQCDGQWESDHSHLYFVVKNSSHGFMVKSADIPLDPDMQLDYSDTGFTMVVPWSLPDDLQDSDSDSRTVIEGIVQKKLQDLLSGFEKPVQIELLYFQPASEAGKTEFFLMSFDPVETKKQLPLPVDEQLDYIRSLNTPEVTVEDGVIYWDSPDLCDLSAQTLCPPNSWCINTLGSYTCVCQHGYYDVSGILQLPQFRRPVCNEKGLFSQCLDRVMTGGIAKQHLTSYIGGKVDVKLNDGRCAVGEDETFYLFRTSRRGSECGTEMLVNKTHIEFQNTFTVTLTKEETISRRDLRVVWKCVYPLHYIRNAEVRVHSDWLRSFSIVEFNSTLQLLLAMTLYKDRSYSDSFKESPKLLPDDILFFQVALQTNNTFASHVLLQVDSCWATETSDPQDNVKAMFLEDGCPTDSTFWWLTDNGLAQMTRFSLQMFRMPQELPLFFHCLANICDHKEPCTKTCPQQQRRKRALDKSRKQTALVSAGPLVVSTDRPPLQPTSLDEHFTRISIAVGLIGMLGLTVLLLSAVKAIVSYYEHRQRQ